MAVTHYYILVAQGTNIKNSLDKAIYEYLQSIDGKLFENRSLSYTKQTILDKIKDLNNEHKRCKPFEVRFWKPGGKCVAKLTGYYSANLYIREAELVEHI